MSTHAQSKAPYESASRLNRWFSWSKQHFVLLLLYVTFALVAIGLPQRALVMSCVGVVLCVYGISSTGVKVDISILVALLVYDAFSMISSIYHDGTIMTGFAPTQNIYTVVYIAMAMLDDSDLGLLRRMCGVTGGVMAAYSIGVYAIVQIGSIGGRLRGFPDSPNAYGIFLVMCWFALIGSAPKRTLCFEPLLLTAVALTLSMSSFLSLGAGMLVMCLLLRKSIGKAEAFREFLWLASRAVFVISIGVFIYICARLVRMQWLTWTLLGYLVVACWNWKSFCDYLRSSLRMMVVLLFLAALTIAAVLFLRSSAADTFSERVGMMGSGLKYTVEHPIVGLGPMGWAEADFNDGGVFFNVNHVHNFFLAVGSELGLIAMGAAVFITIRFFWKRTPPAVKAEGAALFVHSMLDTGLLFPSIGWLSFVTLPNPRVDGSPLNKLALCIILGIFLCLIIFALR